MPHPSLTRPALLGVLIAALFSPAIQAAEAFGSPGAAPVRGPASKSFIGTAVNSPSRVYFTGYRGIVSEVYYPALDTPESVDLQFLVGDAGKTFVDEEKRQAYSAGQSDKRTMSWIASTGNDSHNWRISKRIFADPNRDALVQRVTFTALNGHTVGDFNLYVLFKPYLDNAGSGNSAQTVAAAGGYALTASRNSRASALMASLPWKTVNGQAMLSNGFVGQSDGWTDLIGSGDNTMNWAYGSATNGNVAQTGWLDLGDPAAASVSFDMVLAFGKSQGDAVNAAAASLGSDLSAAQQQYDNAWHAYAAGLSTQGGLADDRYYLAAMTLKTMQDKSNGAMIAGIGTPWGETQGDANQGGYHLVWPRDLFKFANALYTAGDAATATAVVNYLFNTLQQSSDCGAAEYNAPGCAAGYSRVGRFPQNAWVSGWPYWQGTQMDEQAMPILLAWRLGPSVSNPLWPKIKQTADYIVATGPWSYQERWEENSGYSPSTLAAEIAGLAAAADIARANGDDASAGRYLSAADYWQQNVAAWTYTTSGGFGNGSYYLRINPANRAGSGADRASFNPAAGPDTPQTLTVKNGGGSRDARRVVDGGFLELVRMGVKRAGDPTIVNTISVFDSVLGQYLALPGAPKLPANAWFRYNFDGYGEHNDGGDFDGAGVGRLWPIFTAERGMYEIARQGAGSAGQPYFATLKLLATPEGMLPEQVWSNSATLPDGWAVTTPAGYQPGSATKSMGPLNWAMGEYISLLASINAGRIVDVPQVACARYNNCRAAPKAGEVAIAINAAAGTQWGQQVYVTGNVRALGNWNTDLGIPLDAAAYPSWRNGVNLPASQQIAYKYYRKNADGSVSWENRSGNRSLQTPASGSLNLNDQVSW
ncbi:glycoside hydrolase family 15 protein [Chromobacterium vaccinii]|uniref:glycoside hydrolase family 15 protein n=1 Tax=Chromobacterium vaccinii TaxID=1108595 RepID=UPI001E298A89|nr:glycoside hydrolase family 15 protein [Chromobacterium vaccinii]MCD4500197.1 glycoside hydrolase family 15 protein [Chromobacterium vaccinii]